MLMSELMSTHELISLVWILQKNEYIIGILRNLQWQMEPIAGLFGNCIEDLEYFFELLISFSHYLSLVHLLMSFFSFLKGPLQVPLFALVY